MTKTEGYERKKEKRLRRKLWFRKLHIHDLLSALRQERRSADCWMRECKACETKLREARGEIRRLKWLVGELYG